MEQETLATRQVYQGRIVNLRVDEVRLPNGHTTIREVVEHGGAVAIVAVDEDNQVLLIKQHRYAVGESLLELPAGTLEAGESPLECAIRELSEETGYRAGNWEPLVTIYPSPGYTTEIIHLFVARQLVAGPPQPEADEFIKVLQMPLHQAVTDLVHSTPAICNGVTVVGLLTAAQKLNI